MATATTYLAIAFVLFGSIAFEVLVILGLQLTHELIAAGDTNVEVSECCININPPTPRIHT